MRKSFDDRHPVIEPWAYLTYGCLELPVNHPPGATYGDHSRPLHAVHGMSHLCKYVEKG